MYHKHHQYFLTISECQSITKASEKLFVSQPYLSKYLKELEDCLGVKLFERRKNIMRLTCAGERYQKYIHDCAILDRRLIKELDEVNSDTRGHIAIGLHMWRSSKLLPEILPPFLEKYPNVEVELFEGTSPYLQSLLMQDKLDFCIMNLPIDYDNFNYEIIMREKILLAGSIENPIVQEELKATDTSNELHHFDITKLNGQTLCLMKTGEQINTKISGILNRYNVTPSKIVETTNQNTALNLAQTGFCFTFVPQGGTHYQHPSESLAYFTVGSPVLSQTLVAVYSKEYELSRLSRNMLDQIKSEYIRWADDLQDTQIISKQI